MPTHKGEQSGLAGLLLRRLSLAICLIVFSLGVFSDSPAQSESCEACKPKVRISYKASVCSITDVNIDLAGTRATGTGNCAANSWMETNRVFADLVPDQTYQLTVSESCAVHINFSNIPDEYTLEIDGKEKTTIDKGGETPTSGQGTWSVVLRRKCPCGNGNAGESAGPKLGSVSWEVGLGSLSDGRSAQNISIRQDALSAAIYTPGALIYSPPGLTAEVDVVRGTDGNLRQVKAPQTLADIIVISGTEYDVRFYRAADTGAKVSGVYTVAGQPFVTWKIKNPFPGSNSKLQLSKTQNSVTEMSEYAWDEISGSWSLSTGGGSRVETKTVVYPTQTSRTETITVRNNSGQVTSKVARTYNTFSWGDALVQEVIDPDGVALTTAYTFYEDAADDGRYGKTKTVKYPDGSWAKFDYDSSGNKVLIMRPWKDLSLAAATENNSYTIRYTYSNYDGIDLSLHPRLVSGITEKVAGTIVKKTTFTRSGTSVNGEPAVMEVQTVYSSSTVSETTSTTSYHSSASPFLANRLALAVYADGRKDTYTYEKGDYTLNANPALNQFTPGASGSAQRMTLVHGTTALPNGVAMKTTKEVAVLDQYGHTVLQESYVYGGALYERLAWAVMDYDDRGHLTQTRRHTGQITSFVWSGDQKSSEIDAAGIETTYTYDSLGRIRTQTRKGVAASGSFPAQADIVTTISYDSEGRQVGETITGGSLSLSKTSAYDVAGRLKTVTDQAGLLTTYSYANGGRVQTTMLPGGATQIIDKFLDGHDKSVTGTSVIAQAFDYGVNADGTLYAQRFAGSAGLSSPRWTKTTTDWLGRTIKVEQPAFNGSVLVRASLYNGKGQLQAETVTTGANRLQADKLYEYDELGNQIRAGLDVDLNGTLTALSTDRINEADVVYEKSGNDWFRVSTIRTYLVNGNDTPTIQLQRERLTNFPVNGSEKTISELLLTDVAGNTTRIAVSVDRVAKRTTNITDVPDSNVDAINISLNGLSQSSSPSTPQSATTYTYDALGRPTGMTDPRTGTNTKAYSPTTGQLISTADAAQSISYEYYPSTHTSAGRLKAQTDGNGKKVYFNYSGRGELMQTWGDTTYPLEYVYDAYGQRIEQHTFRGGSNWNSSAWPSSTTGTADVTSWIYHEPTGLLEKKQDAATKQAVYTYDVLGRLSTRAWARPGGATATYAYDPQTAELTAIDYADATPDVTFAYDRGGRQSGVTDAAGAHTRTFNARGELETEQIAGGILDLVQVSAAYDGFLRRQSLQSSRGGTVLGSQSYTYDSASRLETITSGGQSVTYAYYPSNGLLNTTTFTGGAQTARSFDALGRLQAIATTAPSAGTVSSYTYTYNNLSQRTRATLADGSYWAYSYNDRGELLSGKKYWADNSPAWGQQTEYAYDSIGNRVSVRAGGNELGSLRQSGYTVNSLNQYVQRNVPGAVDVLGSANSAATVSVNNQAAARKGDYFYRELAVDNGTAPVNAQVNVTGARQNFGAGGEDAVTEKGGRIYVPAAQETYGYDADGNLTVDGRWTYAWDGENRLSSMEAMASVPADARQRLEFTYDWMGRRIQKKVYGWNVGTGAYQLTAITKFVYDGWEVLEELDASNTLTRSFVWGQDVSRSLQGAGGIGGLLLINEGGNTYQAGYDGNGNVVTLLKAGTGTIAADYEYDPFANTLKAVGEYAARNPFKFSTRYTDIETGLIYYGYRYSNPQTGRWLSKDPLGEQGGANLYLYDDNDAIDLVDPLGLQQRPDDPLQRVADALKFKHYDKNSPNWDSAAGAMDHTLHSITLRICNIDARTAMDKIYAGLKRFENFTPNIATLSINGDRGHFSLRWTEPISKVGSATPYFGNSLDVIFHANDANRELFAVTTGDHPLVGVRKWWTDDVGDRRNKFAVRIKISTEAYEQTNGWGINQIARSISGRGKQSDMWTRYLDNIADAWRKNYRATVEEKPTPVVESTDLTYNPFKSMLPSRLQSSQYYYDYNPF